MRFFSFSIIPSIKFHVRLLCQILLCFPDTFQERYFSLVCCFQRTHWLFVTLLLYSLMIFFFSPNTTPKLYIHALLIYHINLQLFPNYILAWISYSAFAVSTYAKMLSVINRKNSAFGFLRLIVEIKIRIQCIQCRYDTAAQYLREKAFINAAPMLKCKLWINNRNKVIICYQLKFNALSANLPKWSKSWRLKG